MVSWGLLESPVFLGVWWGRPLVSRRGPSLCLSERPAGHRVLAVALAPGCSDALLLAGEPDHGPLLLGEPVVGLDGERQRGFLDELLVLDAGTPERVNELLQDQVGLVPAEVHAVVVDADVLGDEAVDALAGASPGVLALVEELAYAIGD